MCHLMLLQFELFVLPDAQQIRSILATGSDQESPVHPGHRHLVLRGADVAVLQPLSLPLPHSN